MLYADNLSISGRAVTSKQFEGQAKDQGSEVKESSIYKSPLQTVGLLETVSNYVAS